MHFHCFHDVSETILKHFHFWATKQCTEILFSGWQFSLMFQFCFSLPFMDVLFWKVDVQDSVILLNFPFLYYATNIALFITNFWETATYWGCFWKLIFLNLNFNVWVSFLKVDKQFGWKMKFLHLCSFSIL